MELRTNKNHSQNKNSFKLLIEINIHNQEHIFTINIKKAKMSLQSFM